MAKISIKAFLDKRRNKKEIEKEKAQKGYIHLVIGASRLGANIAQRHAKRGLYVTIVDKDPESSNRLDEGFTGAFVCGDAVKISTLEEANVKAAREIVIATDDDDTNIMIANIIYAKYNKTNLVVRIDDQTKHDLLLTNQCYIINPYIDSIAQYIQNYRRKEKER
ncbi:MAG: NAD-binding protein [Bacilli bacterium]|nr:NAD-binding protein [Bacilli bacterium]